MTQHSASVCSAHTGIFESLKKNQVILTASICLIALAVVLKNVLSIPPDILMRDMIVYILIYFGFTLFTFKTDETEKNKEKIAPILWDVLIVMITLAIIAVYAL